VADCSKFAGRHYSAKASVFQAVVRTYYVAPRTCYQRKTEGGIVVDFGVEMDIISRVDKHLTVQCLEHQTGEFELQSPLWSRRLAPVMKRAAALCNDWSPS